MNTPPLFKSKIFIFLAQFGIFSLLIWLTNHTYTIDFDKGITNDRKEIIQFIANYIMYESTPLDVSGLFFIYLSWFAVGLIPILIHQDYKKAYSMNLMTFFFPNFFFYIFLSRFSPNYYEDHFISMFSQTILLGIVLVIYSISLSLVVTKITEGKNIMQQDDLKKIEDSISSICPHCGAEFDSIPLFCYKCSKRINDVE